MALDASFLLVICDKPRVCHHLPHTEAEREEPRPPVLTRLSAAVQPGAREWGGQGAVPRHLWLSCGPFKRTSPAPAVSSKLCVHALEVTRRHLHVTLSDQEGAVRWPSPCPLGWQELTQEAGKSHASVTARPSQSFRCCTENRRLPAPGEGQRRANCDRCLPVENLSPRPPCTSASFRPPLGTRQSQASEGEMGEEAAKQAKSDLGRKRSCFDLKR